MIFALNYSCSFPLVSTNRAAFNWFLLMQKIAEVAGLSTMLGFSNSTFWAVTSHGRQQERCRAVGQNAQTQGRGKDCQMLSLTDHAQPNNMTKTRAVQGQLVMENTGGNSFVSRGTSLCFPYGTPLHACCPLLHVRNIAVLGGAAEDS